MDIFGKVMSLLFNMLFRFVIAFLSRSKHLLNSWLQSPSGVILESKKLKSVTVSIVFPSICHEVMGPDAMILFFFNVEAWLGEFWSLLCLCVRRVQLCSNLNLLWHCLSLGLEWKLTFPSPVTTAEFSKFAGILSTALSQHHILGFEITELKFHHLH